MEAAEIPHFAFGLMTITNQSTAGKHALFWMEK
jgi:hypothetical protein